MSINLTPSSNCQGVLLAGADLWSDHAGYEMDLGVSLTGGTYGSGTGPDNTNIVNWKETGGLNGPYSPGATYGALPRPLLAGTPYTISLAWKTNISDPNNIYAGAGGGYPYSPTALAVLCYPVS